MSFELTLGADVTAGTMLVIDQRSGRLVPATPETAASVIGAAASAAPAGAVLRRGARGLWHLTDDALSPPGHRGAP